PAAASGPAPRPLRPRAAVRGPGGISCSGGRPRRRLASAARTVNRPRGYNRPRVETLPNVAGHDDPLGRDVSTLGRLLGEVLREQEDDAGFELVEDYRARTKALRANEP